MGACERLRGRAEKVFAEVDGRVGVVGGGEAGVAGLFDAVDAAATERGSHRTVFAMLFEGHHKVVEIAGVVLEALLALLKFIEQRHLYYRPFHHTLLIRDICCSPLISIALSMNFSSSIFLIPFMKSSREMASSLKRDSR